MLPDLADFVLQIDEEQLAQVEKKFAEDNKKLVKESVKGAADERRERLAKKYVDQFEEFTGRLTREQREIVTNAVARFPELTEERLGDRRYRQLEAMGLVRSKAPREKVVAELKRLLIDTESWRRPEYVKKMRERDELMFAAVSELSATLTAEQRTQLQRKLRGYVKDISEIVAVR
jgi:LPS O-antigen subunit length determinant protein (WzzB/FepE family)